MYDKVFTKKIYILVAVYHHHRLLIPLSGVGTTCFFLPFSSITRHDHSFFSTSSFTQSIYLFFAQPTRVPIYIHTHHPFCYVTFIPSLNMPIPTLLLLIFSDTGATFKQPVIYSFLILSMLVTPHNNIHLKIRISVTCSLLSSLNLVAQHSI
jgi:hypothetical protein